MRDESAHESECSTLAARIIKSETDCKVWYFVFGSMRSFLLAYIACIIVRINRKPSVRGKVRYGNSTLHLRWEHKKVKYSSKVINGRSALHADYCNAVSVHSMKSYMILAFECRRAKECERGEGKLDGKSRNAPLQRNSPLQSINSSGEKCFCWTAWRSSCIFGFRDFSCVFVYAFVMQKSALRFVFGVCVCT